eukprot:m.160950 g.160950  ORF g.160950 m.160950 type:complete len:225 (-) comp16368_c0_seq5:1656-2330(-)
MMATPSPSSTSSSSLPPAAAISPATSQPRWSVLLFVPNLLGYARLLLLIAAFFVFWRSPVIFILLYSVQAILDGIDGYVARKLGQTSSFGAWFDVVVDNAGRTLLWCYTSPSLGPLIACVEWVTFSCTHTSGPAWKTQFDNAPAWVAAVMANGFRTPTGIFVIAGIHVLPIVLYGKINHVDEMLFPTSFAYVAYLLLLTGRLYGLLVECWVIARHVRALLAIKS